MKILKYSVIMFLLLLVLLPCPVLAELKSGELLVLTLQTGKPTEVMAAEIRLDVDPSDFSFVSSTGENSWRAPGSLNDTFSIVNPDGPISSGLIGTVTLRAARDLRNPVPITARVLRAIDPFYHTCTLVIAVDAKAENSVVILSEGSSLPHETGSPVTASPAETTAYPSLNADRYPVQACTTVKSVNVRQDPDINSNTVIRIRNAGSVVMVTGETVDTENTTWFAVSVPDGKEGYIRGDLLSFAAEDPETPSPTSAGPVSSKTASPESAAPAPVDLPDTWTAERPALHLKQKLVARLGPSTDYDSAGTYFSKNYKKTEVTVISKDQSPTGGWWAQVEFVYKDKLIRVYTTVKRLNGSMDDIPQEKLLARGQINAEATAYYGPGTNYAVMKSAVPAGTDVEIWGAEDNYYLVDYRVSPKGSARRSWVEKQLVSNLVREP